MSETAVLRVKVDASGMVTGAAQGERALDGLARSAGTVDASMGRQQKTMRDVAGAYAAGAIAVTAVVGALGHLASAAMEAEENENRLAAAVRRRGVAFGASTEQLLAMSAQLQNVTRFEDDAIQQAQAVLTKFSNIDGSNIEAVTRATLDFAQATGRDAASAATVLGKALIEPGQAMRALKEVGIGLNDAQQRQIDTWNETGQTAKSVAALVGLLNDKVGGEAESAARTGAGGIDQLKNALDDLAEVAGGPLIQDLSKLTGWVRKLTEALSGDEAKRVGRVWLGIQEIFLSFGVAWQEGFANVKAGLTGQATEAEQLALSLKLVGDNGRHASKGMSEFAAVTGPTNDQLAEGKRVAAEYARELESLRDRLDPAGSAAQDLAADVKFLAGAMDSGKVVGDEAVLMWGNLTGDWSAAADVAANLTFEILKVATAQERLNAAVGTGATDGTPGPRGAVATATVTRVELPTDEMDRAAEDFTRNLSDGMGQAVADFAREFIETGELNVKRLGDMLLDVLLDAAQQYFATMLANQAKLKMTGGGGGGGGGMGSLASLFGGGGGAGAGGISSGAIALGAWVAVAAAAVAVLKHQVDRANAVRYQTTVQYNTGSDSLMVGGKLMETGGKIADAFKALLESVETSTGALLEGAHRAAIAVRNDKQGFRALVDGVVVGTFKTMDEAIVAAMKKLFSAENLKNQMDPILQQVVNNFDASKGPQAFSEALDAVSKIVNAVSGLSDIEISLRDLPSQAQQLAAKLHEMGVAMADAEMVAAKWTIQQLSSIRDQITGHQMSAAEQRAEKERQALFFNAQLALMKANMALRKGEIESEIAALKAKVEITNTKYELDKWQLENERDFAQQGAEIAQAELDVRYAAGQASIALLEAQLAAINESMAALAQIKPIDLREIRLPNLGGGGGHVGSIDSGPSPEEQRAADFAQFIKEQMGLGLSDLQRRLAVLDEAFAAQAQAASEVEGGEIALAVARRVAIDALNEDLIDGLGSPMEALRDRFADMREVIDQIRASATKGSDTLGHLDQVLGEIGMQAQSEILGLAAEIADAFGMDKEAAEFRQKVAELELRLKIIQLQLLFKEYSALGMIDEALSAIFKDFFLFIGDPANWPDFSVPEPPPVQTADNGAADAFEEARKRREQALISALDRLRNALDKYRQFQEDLRISDLSGRTLQQRSADAFTLYQQTLAQAQAGNLDAIENLPGIAQQYLQILGQFVDPSSAQYQTMVAQIRAAMSGIEGGIEGILTGANNPAQQQVAELQNIAEILNAIRDLWGQNLAWRPGGGAGTILPGPGTGTQGNPNAAGEHPGMVNYGDYWGWHPLGWSPPGGWNHGAGSSATQSSSSQPLRVTDADTQNALSRMEQKLDAGFSKVAFATNKQTEYAKARDLRSPATGSRTVGSGESDRMAS